jgi:hypothetical protein
LDPLTGLVLAHQLYQRLGFRAVAEGFKLYFDSTP